jgi:regulator of protease activity HflC (stomatin/prohibitin superfamily)
MERGYAAKVCSICFVSIAALLQSTNARAEPLESTPALILPVAARLVGGAGHAGGGVGQGARGLLLGLDVGPTVLLGGEHDSARAGAGFGARLGYAFGNGLDLQARFDLLGVTLPDGTTRDSLRVPTFGLRYSVPFLFPSPFLEVGAGPALVGDTAWFGAMAGAGVTFPVAAHASIDLAARDWLVPAPGLRQVLGGQLGLSVHFLVSTIRREGIMKSNLVWLLVRVVAIVLGALASTGCSYATVGSGQVGVLWTPSGMSQKALPEGSWPIGFYDHATLYDTRSQEKDEELEVLAANGLRILFDTSIRYHIIPEQVVQIEREMGKDYYAVLLGPTLRSQARRVVGRYQPEEIYSTQRELIERQIREGVDKAIEGKHVVLEAVLIRNVRLPDTIQQAINNKLEAEQLALKMKYVIAQSEAESQKALLIVKAEAEQNKIRTQAEAEQNKIKAQGEAETSKIEAESQATTKRIQASAIDDFNKTIASHLTAMILRLREIEAMESLSRSENAKVLMLGQGGHTPTILDVK